MRATRYLLPTLRDAPGDAVAESHKLLVRAGMVRQVGAGMWTWLPLGWRVKKRVQQIIREEMDAHRRSGDAHAGAAPGRDLEAPGTLRTSTWSSSLRDRAERELVLAMTHEEIMALHAGADIRSLSRPAADLVPPPDQGARRAAAPGRRTAHPRVHR